LSGHRIRPRDIQQQISRAPAAKSNTGGVFGLPDLVTLVVVDQQLPCASPAKNMLLGTSAVLGATSYILGGLVEWLAVVPLAMGLFGRSLPIVISSRRRSSHV
jgi:hypothetical protein